MTMGNTQERAHLMTFEHAEKQVESERTPRFNTCERANPDDKAFRKPCL